MGKRGNVNQLTKDEYDAGGSDDDGNDENVGEFQVASKEKLQGRRIVSVRKGKWASSTSKSAPSVPMPSKVSDKSSSSNPFQSVQMTSNVSGITETSSNPFSTFTGFTNSNQSAAKLLISPKVVSSPTSELANTGNLIDDLIAFVKDHKQKYREQRYSAGLREILMTAALPKKTANPKASTPSIDPAQPTPKPETAIPSNFSFGTKIVPSSTDTTTKTSDDNKMSSTTSASFTGFSFSASTAKSSTGPPEFSFGTSTAKSYSGPPEFSFGKPTAQAIGTPTPQPQGDDEDAFPTEEKEKVEREKNTDEDIVYECRAKLFKWNDGKWQAGDVGALRVMKHKTKDSCRIVLRSELGHVRMNESIGKSMSFEKDINPKKSTGTIKFRGMGGMFLLKTKIECVNKLHATLEEITAPN